MHVSKRLEVLINEINPKIYEALRYGAGNPKKGDYLDISSKEGEISYLPTKRMEKLEGDPYLCYDLRVTGKPIRILKQFVEQVKDPWQSFNDLDTSLNSLNKLSFMDANMRQRTMNGISDREWELFGYSFEAYSKEPELIEVTGEDIRKYYLHDNYNKKLSLPELQNSCMRRPEHQYQLDLYVKNPHSVSLLVELDDEGLVMGRALLWKTDTGDTFMDRIYGNERTVAVFRRYAKARGWLHLRYNTYSNPMDLCQPDGSFVKKTLRVPVNDYYGLYPYLDTMKNVYRKKGTYEYLMCNNHTDYENDLVRR